MEQRGGQRCLASSFIQPASSSSASVALSSSSSSPRLSVSTVIHGIRTTHCWIPIQPIDYLETIHLRPLRPVLFCFSLAVGVGPQRQRIRLPVPTPVCLSVCLLANERRPTDRPTDNLPPDCLLITYNRTHWICCARGVCGGKSPPKAYHHITVHPIDRSEYRPNQGTGAREGEGICGGRVVGSGAAFKNGPCHPGILDPGIQLL